LKIKNGKNCGNAQKKLNKNFVRKIEKMEKFRKMKILKLKKIVENFLENKNLKFAKISKIFFCKI